MSTTHLQKYFNTAPADEARVSSPTTAEQTAILVSNLVNDQNTTALLKKHGLVATSVAWEDTGRSKNSSLGPNISDMTLVVRSDNKDVRMPMIRYPNYKDLTTDVPSHVFHVPVGNEKRHEILDKILLSDYLGDLFCSRDSNILTSVQCCVLPVRAGKVTEFTVQLFNYQSEDDDPAVLAVMVTRGGTSSQIITRKNQNLLFNDELVGKYLSVKSLQDTRTDSSNDVVFNKATSYTDMSSTEMEDNMILIFQVPLVTKPRAQSRGSYSLESYTVVPESMACRGMDYGQIKVGSTIEKTDVFERTAKMVLKRDVRFPIRCTVQYYRVTDQDNVIESDVADIANQLKQYSSLTSSLVTETTSRVTEPTL